MQAIVGVSCGQPRANDIEGSIVLHDARFTGRMDKPCHQLLPGYDDIRGGTQVIVRNELGEVIASSELMDGTYTWAPAVWQPGAPVVVRNSGDPTYGSCIFRFALTAVPKSEFYDFSIGRRGSVVYSHAEMEWFFRYVLFSLGGLPR